MFYRADQDVDGRIELLRSERQQRESRGDLRGDGPRKQRQGAACARRTAGSCCSASLAYLFAFLATATLADATQQRAAENGVATVPARSDRTRAVFHNTFNNGLFSAHVSGATPVQLSPTVPGRREARSPRRDAGLPITPDGTHVLLLFDPDVGGGKLFMSPSAQHAARSAQHPVPSGTVDAFVLDPLGSSAVYLTSTYAPTFHNHLGAARFQPSADQVGPPAGDGVQFDFAFSPDGRTVLQRIDLQQAGAYDLYASVLHGGRSNAPAATPTETRSR